MVDRTEPRKEILEEQAIEQEKPAGVWLVMVEGSRSEQGSGAGVIIRSPEGVEVSYAVKFEFQLTNNQAKYEAFITGLGLAHALRAERVEIRADPKLQFQLTERICWLGWLQLQIQNYLSQFHLR